MEGGRLADAAHRMAGCPARCCRHAVVPRMSTSSLRAIGRSRAVDLRDYLDILRARWKLITVTTLLGVAVAAIASMLATPLYTAKATVFVSVGDNADVNAAYTGSLFAQQRVKSYVDVVTSDDVMGPVVEKLGLPLTPQALASKVDVNNPLDTVNLE